MDNEETNQRQAEYERYRERLAFFDRVQKGNRDQIKAEYQKIMEHLPNEEKAVPLPFKPVLDNIGARNDRALEAALDEYLKKRVDKIEEKE